jgi:hypothetical protein
VADAPEGKVTATKTLDCPLKNVNVFAAEYRLTIIRDRDKLIAV